MHSSHSNKKLNKYLHPILLIAIVCLLTWVPARQVHATCGNGIITGGEQCDNGSQCADGLDCTSHFVACINSGTCLFQNDQVIHSTDCDACLAAACAGGSLCEPRNGVSCNANCTVPVCGNGTKEFAEQCDDGKSCKNGTSCTTSCFDGSLCVPRSGDGCSANCTVEVCGNGIKDVGEQCDDGNTNNFDGCNNNCQFQCVGFLGPDGIREAPETCDPKQNLLTILSECGFNKSGCSSNCRCAICGNGIVAGTDECDEGAKCADGTPCTICDRDNDPTGSSCITDPCTGQAFDPEDPLRCRERESNVCTADCMLKCDPDHKAIVCHDSHLLCVDNHAVPAHLAQGDTEVKVDEKGACGEEQSGEGDNTDHGSSAEEGDNSDNESSVETETPEIASSEPPVSSQNTMGDTTNVTGGCSLTMGHPSVSLGLVALVVVGMGLYRVLRMIKGERLLKR
jgi:cysteine-rich repeat protein